MKTFRLSMSFGASMAFALWMVDEVGPWPAVVWIPFVALGVGWLVDALTGGAA